MPLRWLAQTLRLEMPQNSNSEKKKTNSMSEERFQLKIIRTGAWTLGIAALALAHDVLQLQNVLPRSSAILLESNQWNRPSFFFSNSDSPRLKIKHVDDVQPYNRFGCTCPDLDLGPQDASLAWDLKTHEISYAFPFACIVSWVIIDYSNS
eukprot:Gb_10552 [translate_table: standard]